MKGLEVITNLTPHEVKIVDDNGKVIQSFLPSGKVARVSMDRQLVEEVGGVPVYVSTPGKVIDLPPESDNVGSDKQWYIVSALVRNALPKRNDLLSPADFVRDEAGNILGCKSFDRNVTGG